MFQQNGSQLSQLAVHYVGNKLKDGNLELSKHPSGIDEPTLAIVWQYVFKAFSQPNFYAFSHPTQLEMNNVYALAKSLFAEPGRFLEKSADLAKLLFEASQHPQVKSGELVVMYFDNLKFNHLSAPAIGLFKSEQKQPFLFTEKEQATIELYSYQGISPAKVDKAALIFNTDADDGFQVLCVDNLNKGEATKFWFDDFLKLKLRNTEYAQTSALIGATKSFIEQDLKTDQPLERTDALGYLERSKGYLSETENYTPEEYGLEVFEDATVANRFREYVSANEAQAVNLDTDFAISAEAVKKKQTVFKSVLKLDKNFHIYVHGNRQMIEKGTDEQGRKYYKLYYQEES
jgi:hypothetical protein